MELTERTIKIASRKDIITIFALGDLHVASVAFEKDRFNAAVRKIVETPHSLWIGMGDLGECINIKDKRFDQKCLREPYCSNLHSYHQMEANELEELLSPIAEKCLGILVGNHEDKLRQAYGYDLMLELCTHFGWKNLSMEAMIRLNVERQEGHNMPLRIFATHGYGGTRTDGGALLKLEKARAEFLADIYLMGHEHKNLGDAKGYLTIPTTGKLRLKEYPQKLILVPSFHKTYQVGIDNYAAKRLYSTSALGISETTCRIRNATLELPDGQFAYEDEWETKTMVV